MRLLNAFFAMGYLFCLNACSSNFVSWDEEVRLNDGRVITVNQRKNCETKYICREAWLTVNLPDFGIKNVIWHEHLQVMTLNIDNGHAFLIAYPPTEREFHQYGQPHPFYVCYVFDGKDWKRINFSDVPKSIYDANMLVNSIPPRGVGTLTLNQKESRELNGSPYYPKYIKKMDPTATDNDN